MSTLAPPTPLPTPKEDALHLYSAFRGYGCDEKVVINILARRDAEQRDLIKKEYKSIYTADLNQRLISELSGNLEIAVLLWMEAPNDRLATIVKQGIRGKTYNLEAATQIICSSTPSEIIKLKQIYHTKFGVELDRDLEKKTSGNIKKLLVTFVNTSRSEGTDVDQGKADDDAKALFMAGERKKGIDEKVFIKIFSESSREHLRAISKSYRSMYGSSLSQAIKKETSGTFQCAFLIILRSMENIAKYLSRVAYKAMKGFGTDDATLLRVIVTRTEIDLEDVKAEYQKKYGKTLYGAVYSETSGGYQNFLLTLIGPKN